MKLRAVIVGLILGCQALAALPERLVNAIHMTESSGKRVNVRRGDGGRALGPFQIHRRYWQDAIAWNPRIGGKYEDCRSYAYSVKIVESYLERWAPKFLQSGRWDLVARIHNGGPEGHLRVETGAYWLKVNYWLRQRHSSFRSN